MSNNKLFIVTLLFFANAVTGVAFGNDSVNRRADEARPSIVDENEMQTVSDDPSNRRTGRTIINPRVGSINIRVADMQRVSQALQKIGVDFQSASFVKCSKLYLNSSF